MMRFTVNCFLADSISFVCLSLLRGIQSFVQLKRLLKIDIRQCCMLMFFFCLGFAFDNKFHTLFHLIMFVTFFVLFSLQFHIVFIDTFFFCFSEPSLANYIHRFYSLGINLRFACRFYSADMIQCTCSSL